MNRKVELFIYLIRDIISKIKKLDKLYFMGPLYVFTLAAISRLKHQIIICFKTPLKLTPELFNECLVKKIIITEFLKIIPEDMDIKKLNTILTIVYMILTNNDNK